MLLQITEALLQITTMLLLQITAALSNYYKLQQLLVLLQIKQLIITNYVRYYKLRHYYKLRRNNGERENSSTMLDQTISKMVKRNQVTNHFLSRLTYQKGVTCYCVKLGN